MPTIEEQEELVDLIKHGPRLYRIRLWGYGGEVVLGKLTNDQGSYWSAVSEEEFSDYMMSWQDDRSERFSDVPKECNIEYEWHEMGDILHSSGVTTDRVSTYIVIERLKQSSANEYNPEILETIYEGSIGEFLDQYGAEFDGYTSGMDYGDLSREFPDTRYVFFGMSVEKGEFSNFMFQLNGKPDWSRLRFTEHEIPNGDVFIDRVYFANPDGTEDKSIEIDDVGGDGTTGKGMYTEVWDLHNT